jgi:PAS domain S-box-containing protein
MKIRHKLIVGYVAVALLVAAIGYLGIMMTSTAKTGFNMATNHTIPKLQSLEVMKFAGLRIVSSTNEYGLIRAEKELLGKKLSEPEQREEQLIELGIRLYADALKEYEGLLNKFPTQEGVLEDIRQKGLRLQDTSKELLRFKEQGVYGLQILGKKEDFERDEKAFLAAVDAAIAYERKEFFRKKTDLESSLVARRNLGIAATVISVIVAIIIGTLISRSISNAVNVLRDAAGEIGKGNLDARAEIKSNDELGQLAASFNKMGGDLQRYHENLEALVVERTTELKSANEQLQREIAERNRTEEALRESEKHYRETINAMGDWILVVDPDLRIVLFNEAFTRVNKELGLTTDVIGRTPMKIFPFLPDTLLDEYRWVFENKAVLVTQETTKVESREFITESRKIPLLEDGKIVRIASVIRDITESKRLEAQLQHAQKMEAVGTLAGGVAHDFNNLLMGIQGNVSLMLMDMDPAHPDYRRLKQIEKQAQSGSRLTSHLLGYARKGKYEIQPLDLNELVEETSDAFGRTRRHIVIHQDLAAGLFRVEGDPAQIEQVLLNLFVNAADAMPNGGNLFVKCMNVTHKDMKGKLYNPRPGSYVLSTITDTGTGMDKETMERIFDPFFTTKEMGRGTGLGLSSVYGIVKAHGGYIDVDSERGHGTTFSIYLPASEKELQKVVRTAEEVVKGTGTVLLVDDEDMVLQVGQELLEAVGYRVLVAKDGKEGIRVYKKNMGSIDIVILDMVMPNMGGAETYDCIKEINPDAKVLLSSGHSIGGEVGEMLERGCNGFIQKPFTLKELSAKVTEILTKK